MELRFTSESVLKKISILDFVAAMFTVDDAAKRQEHLMGLRGLMPCLSFVSLVCGLLLPAAHAADLTREVEYGKAGEVTLHLDASVPDGAGPFPVVIIVHGGGWASGDKRADPAPQLLAPLTGAGLVCFSVDYRLAPAHRWPACRDDVQTAIRWVKAHAAEYKGDPNCIALVGYSAGGQLVCSIAALNDPTTAVQAVVGMAPPTDLELDLAARGGHSKSLQDLLGLPKEVTDASRKQLRELSAVHSIHAGLPPFLLIHGTKDASVPYAGSVAFREKLLAVGVPCELITIEGAGHRLREWAQSDPHYCEKMIVWLKERLATKTATTAAGLGR